MDKMAIYNKLPIPLQDFACSIEGRRLASLRYGSPFDKNLLGYSSNVSLSGDEVASIRNQKLKTMLRFCYEQVPFYKKLFDDGGVNPYTVIDDRDIIVLPILRKNDVREHVDDLRPSDLTKIGKYITEHTSGSTGSSLVFGQSVSNVRDLWAVFWRFWNLLGIEQGTLCADFGSRMIVPSSQVEPPFWRCCPPLAQVKFSAFHANESNYGEFVKAFDEKGLQWIHGYPSCIVPFAAYVLEKGITFAKPIRWVTTSAENLYDHQRALIKKAFGVDPYSLYALTEATACISERPDHKMVVDEDYSLVELVESPAGYRIVGSNLGNFAFPLLRYDTGDVCSCSGERVNGWRVVDFIDGRSAELVRLPDGGTVGALSALFTESSSVKEAQIVQHADYSVTIKFVSFGEGIDSDIAVARQKFIERTRGLLPVEFKKVELIPRTKRGKLRYVVSEINNG
ncbi:phenylacetate--CoA ligase family protein [Slackia piriformis]